MNPQSGNGEGIPTARTLEEAVNHLIENKWQGIEVASVDYDPKAQPEGDQFFLGLDLKLVIQNPKGEGLCIEVNRNFGYFRRDATQQAQRFSDMAYAQYWVRLFNIQAALLHAEFVMRLLNMLSVRGYAISMNGNPTDGVELAPKLLEPYSGGYTPIAVPTS